MCKWRIVYGFNPDPIPAENYPDQATLESYGVVGGVFDDGVATCFSNPDVMTQTDWDNFVANDIPPVQTLVGDTLPNNVGGSWGANYAWDLN